MVDTVMRVAVDGIDQASCRTPSDSFALLSIDVSAAPELECVSTDQLSPADGS